MWMDLHAKCKYNIFSPSMFVCLQYHLVYPDQQAPPPVPSRHTTRDQATLCSQGETRYPLSRRSSTGGPQTSRGSGEVLQGARKMFLMSNNFMSNLFSFFVVLVIIYFEIIFSSCNLNLDLAGLLKPRVNCGHCLRRDVNQPWFLFNSPSVVRSEIGQLASHWHQFNSKWVFISSYGCIFTAKVLSSCFHQCAQNCQLNTNVTFSTTEPVHWLSQWIDFCCVCFFLQSTRVVQVRWNGSTVRQMLLL